MDEDIVRVLEARLGTPYARERLAIETDGRRNGRTSALLSTDNWYFSPLLIRATLKLFGLYGRGTKNSERIEVRHNRVALRGLPAGFEGFTLLQLSDLHADTNPGAVRRVAELLPDLDYDICVLTGDYRGATFGPFVEAMAQIERLRAHIDSPVYGVLGNHDSIRMVPRLEAMDIQMLLNESVVIEREGRRLHLAGIDDAHYLEAHNIDRATEGIPHRECSILLSHTPEVYRPAAQAGFDLLLSGHTHGGQICLPGNIPVTIDARLPRHMATGAWRYRDMSGYTSTGVGSSIVPVRFNCPPEITLHHLYPA